MLDIEKSPCFVEMAEKNNPFTVFGEHEMPP